MHLRHRDLAAYRLFFERMRRILLVLVPACLIAATPPAVFYSPESLAAELHRIEEALQQGKAGDVTLPAAWEIDARGRRYSISTEPLRNLLPKPAQAELWLEHLADELSYPPSATTAPSADQRLDRILARREFAKKPPPGLLARLWDRFTSWLRDLLLRIFGPMFGSPTTGRILIWTLGLAAAAFLLIWLWRWYRGRTAPVELGLPQDVPTLEASAWLREARDAANRGDLRDAIHACYWAGVTHLQSKRLLPGDFTRTPREYLRTMTRGEASYPPMAALTSGLERFWYADRPVARGDFDEALAHLDALGCRAD